MESIIKITSDANLEKHESDKNIERLDKNDLIKLIYRLKGEKIELETNLDEINKKFLQNESSSNWYSRLYQNSPVGFIIINNDGIIIEANNTIAEMLEIDKAFLVNMPLSRFIAGDDMEDYSYFRKKITTTQSLHSCDVKIIKNNGKAHEVKLDGKILNIGDKPSSNFAIALSDNTSAKSMDKMLRDSEKKYRTLIEGLNEAVFKMSLPDGKYEYVSSSIQFVFGYPLEKIYSAAPLINKIIHPSLKDKFEKQWQRILDGKVEPTYEYKIIDSDGKERWVLQSNRAIYDENGKITALEGLCRNITEVKIAEQTVRESAERFRAIANYTYDWENWNGPEGNLIWINPSVERITGYTVAECLSMEDFPMPILFEDDKEETSRVFHESLEKQKCEDNIQFRIIKKDGEVRWMSASWQPLYNSHNEYCGNRSSIRDVTEKVEAREIMQELIENLRISNETIKKRAFEYNEMNQKYQAEQRKHQEYKEKNMKFFSEISSELVNTFTKFTRVMRIISLADSEIDMKDLRAKAIELHDASEKSIKMIEKYFHQFGI